MIAASEPLEFVPHGRRELLKHPGSLGDTKKATGVLEKSLLFKLTKFAIKDDTFVNASEASENEWWCVRQVFDREIDDVESDNESDSKEFKEEQSDSFITNTRRKSEFNISVKSEIISSNLKRIGSEGNLAHSRLASANTSSNISRKFSLKQQRDEKKVKQLNCKTNSCYEEELYIKGKTAVWSKGLISTPGTRLTEPQFRETISCYTLENPIRHALFCNFSVTINDTMLIDSLDSQLGELKNHLQPDDKPNLKQTKMPSLCLIDDKSVRVFTKKGEDHLSSLPFQVRAAWPMKYGILLEKEGTNVAHNTLFPASFAKYNETNPGSANKSKYASAKMKSFTSIATEAEFPLPTCFSLCHPMDEMSPLLMKSPTHGLQYFNEADLAIVFVSSDPSLVLLYDWKLHTHSLWKLRRATRDECISSCNFNYTTTDYSNSANICSLSASSFGQKQSSNLQKVPGSSWMTGVANLQTSKSKAGIPSMSRSKVFSPSGKSFQHKGLSSHSNIGQVSYMSALGVNTVQISPPSLPIYPEICLEHIWTESQQSIREWGSTPKAFLHTDQIGQDFLCYLVHNSDESRLHLMRLQKSHHGKKNRTEIIAGSISVIPARDAVCLEELKMIAIIDECGNIILYTGPAIVGKVHVGGVLARLITSPYNNKKTTLNSPFPRRSSLLPSRINEASVFDDSALHLLSPVPHPGPVTGKNEPAAGHGLLGLRDSVANRLTLEFDKGVFYRINLPEMSSCSLVERCLNGLKNVLQKDVIIQVIVKWYGVRSAPGSQDMSPDHEWNMFITMLYYMFGYDAEKLTAVDTSDSSSEVVTKRQKTVKEGQQEDWEYLLKSDYNKMYANQLKLYLNLESEDKETSSNMDVECQTKNAHFNPNAILFPHLVQVFYCFHLIYEDIKLSTLSSTDLEPLGKFLHQVSKDLRLESYLVHYWKDFPESLTLNLNLNDIQIPEMHLKLLIQPTYFSHDPPSVYQYINDMLMRRDSLGSYPYICNVNVTSKDLVELIGYIATGSIGSVSQISTARFDGINASSTPRPRDSLLSESDEIVCANAVLMMCEKGITRSSIDNYPPSISLILLSAIERCKENPSLDWPREAYHLLMREDLALQIKVGEKLQDFEDYIEDSKGSSSEKENAFTQCDANKQDILPSVNEDNELRTGMEHLDTKLLRLLYPNDHRLREVSKMLQSSIPATINLPQRHEVSDHDFIEEQEKYLQSVNVRTLALPIARGAITLRTSIWSKSKSASVARVCGWGRGARGERVESTAVVGAWPAFHAGAAAGLALAAGPMPAQWIIYNNKAKGTPESSAEHAGFLLGLGLNGHLKDMTSPNIYDYLVKCQEMISVGFLLGLAATYRGSMDLQATKMMSIHLEALLPPTSIELDIHQNMLVAALMGLGLLYEGTMHLHLCQMLLNEIGKPPGPEMENSTEREGYALAAGLALGHVICGKYKQAPPSLARALRLHITAGTAKPSSAVNKEKYKQPSFQIREGTTVNVDVTAPGSTLALGLLYYRSNDATVADWLSPPTSHYLIDSVRPDLLMLRIIAKSLILWDSIEPTEDWVESQVPDFVRPYCFIKPTESHIDYEAMNQAYCNIVAGACFGMGLRFAGSGDEDATDCLMEFVNQFINLTTRPIGELAGKSTIESCLIVVLLAVSLVTCGRGSIRVLRAGRRLHARVGRGRFAPLSHGAHVAVSMAMGLQFLGGGRCTIRADQKTLPSLIDAFFPKFPTHTDDTRYHLQAFRHLYVLAVEPRLIVPRDINTGKLCYVNLQVVTIEKEEVLTMRAPCILPDLETLKEVRINDSRYWPIVFKRGHNWDQLYKYLKLSWCLDLKKRAGCLSYLDDPHGFLTLLAQNLTLDQNNVWSAEPDNILTFTSDENVRNLTKMYLETLDNSSLTEKTAIRDLCVVMYECVVKDLLCLLPVWTSFLKILKSLKICPMSQHVWQLKIMSSHLETQHQKLKETANLKPLISTEFCQAISQKCTNIFDTLEFKLQQNLRCYLGLKSYEISADEARFVSAYVTYYDLPRNVLKNVNNCDTNLLQCLVELDKCNLKPDVVTFISSIICDLS